MSQETINLLVGALIGILSSLLTLIVGNHFQRKNDERKRKWDLEDRDINRKINAKDEKLQEAQTYLEAYRESLRQLLFLETRLIMSGGSYSPSVHNEVSEAFDKIRSLTNFPFKRLFSIDFLNDPELKEIDKKLRRVFNEEMNYAFELRMKCILKDDINKAVLEQRKGEFNKTISRILGDMQRRLEEISKNGV
jgi:hypothetical protein